MGNVHEQFNLEKFFRLLFSYNLQQISTMRSSYITITFNCTSVVDCGHLLGTKTINMFSYCIFFYC